MNVTHKDLSIKILEYLNAFNNSYIISFEEKVKFNVRLDEEGKVVEFYIGGMVLKKVAINKITDLCLLVIEIESFNLSDLNIDVTDFELSLVYDFLLKHDYDVDSYSWNYQLNSESLNSSFKEDIYYKDMGAGQSDVRSQWIKSLEEKSLPTPEELKSLPEISHNSSQEKQLTDMRLQTVYNKYNITVNFITNRKNTSDKRKHYTGNRDDVVHYGKSIVSIPEDHKSGSVERPKIWKLQINEDAKKHITIKSLEKIEKSEFLSNIKTESQSCKQAMLFVHGFNVSFNDGIYKAAQLKYDLDFDGSMILFSWPSKGSVIRYTHDITNAEYASGALAKALSELTELDINELFLVAHSMGARCLSMALKDLASRKEKSKNIESLILAAPDIDCAHFKDNIIDVITPLFKTGAIYLSDTDRALTLSKMINGYPRLGDASLDIPVFDGIDSIDASDKGNGILKHSYISEDNRVIDDLYHFLFNKKNPKKRRLRDKRNAKNKLYWKFA